jgi:hypothetical protein
VFLPPGTVIDATNVDAWSFPVGTRFWKEFSFNNRRVETRMSWKASPSRWVFASYVWSEEGTDAVLAPANGVPGVVEIGAGKRHDVPSETDCLACHGASGPMGFTALQRSTDRDPNAIHGEPLEPGMITLQTLVETGLLSPARTELVASPPRIATRSPQTRARIHGGQLRHVSQRPWRDCGSRSGPESA